MSNTGQFNNSLLTSISALLLFFLPVIIIGGGRDIHAAPTANYQEALKIIKKHALTLPVNLTGNVVPLKTLVQGIDRFSDFLTPEEYAEFLRSQKSNYIGIGAEIEKSKTGEITLLPYSGSPAEKAGVRFGDILISVNGESINHKSLFLIGAMTRGIAGTTVDIEVRRTTGKRHKFTIKRQQIHTSTVSLQKKDTFWLLKITKFSPSTKRNLKFALEEIDDDFPLIIDIRGNPGGDLNSSIDCAMLFLDKGQAIVEIRRKQGVMKYQSLNSSLGLSNPVVIFQDQTTASAAEIFTAALCMNHKAVSVGKPTYGKGVVQDIFKLHDGSALFLTTGYLIPPDGKKYHQKGISPTYRLAEKAQPDDYWLKVAELLPASPVVALSKNQSPVIVSPSGQKQRIHKTEKKSAATQKTAKTIKHAPIKRHQPLYLCVDKEFLTDSEAHEWIIKNRNRKKIRSRSSVFQNYNDGEISWLACFGPRSTGNSALKTQKLLAKKIGLPVFIKDFDSPENAGETPAISIGKISVSTEKMPARSDVQERIINRVPVPAKTADNHSSTPQWYIQAGIFWSAADAVSEVERIRSHGTHLPVKIYQNVRGKQINLSEELFSGKGITVISNDAFNQRTMVGGYRVVIGPLANNYKTIMDGLKKRRIIPNESFLFHFHISKQSIGTGRDR